MFFLYGFLFTGLSFAFWATLHNYEYPIKSFMRFIYSICAGWLLALGMAGVYSNGLFFSIIKYLMPFLLYLGFQMHLYGLFKFD